MAVSSGMKDTVAVAGKGLANRSADQVLVLSDKGLQWRTPRFRPSRGSVITGICFISIFTGSRQLIR